MKPSSLTRAVGVAAIVALLPYQATPHAPGSAIDWVYANSLVLAGTLPLVTFLWLAVSGAFGYGSPRREDWPALFPFALALAVREGYARHGIAELELHYFYGAFPDRQSVVHPLLQMFLQPLARDPYPFILHVNGILGALAVLPLYLFVRQRTRSRMTGILVAIFFALHPIIVQMAPTDGPYSLMALTWFLGLVLLTADEIRGPQLLGGAGLLAIATACRAEGVLFLVASLLLIDVRALLSAVRHHAGAAAVSFCIVAGLVAVHAYYTFAAHVAAGEALPDFGSPDLSQILRAGLFSLDFNDPVFVALVALGGLAGLVDPRLRIGLGAALAAVLVGWPISPMQTRAFVVVHRLVPVCTLQAIAAGVGASWITILLPSKVRRHWIATIPALALAIYVFVQHRHEVRDPNAVTEEFWMLRNHLAAGGAVKEDCTLLAVGRPMDTDICDLSQVLPGMTVAHCEQVDCVRLASGGGCFYYLRSLNCFYADAGWPPQCRESGRTKSGDLFPCMDPRCTELERELDLSALDERTVDMSGVFYGSPNSWPELADIGLYRVIGTKR